MFPATHLKTTPYSLWNKCNRKKSNVRHLNGMDDNVKYLKGMQMFLCEPILGGPWSDLNRREVFGYGVGASE